MFRVKGFAFQNISFFSQDGVVVIAGDLFEKEEDLADEKIWKDAGSEVRYLVPGTKVSCNTTVLNSKISHSIHYYRMKSCRKRIETRCSA